MGHRLLELNRARNLQFILTGSSARKLKRAGTDLLAGRLTLKTLHPFMAAELGSKFDLNRAMELGMVPLVLAAQDPAETLKSYVALYLREEVQAEGLVRNVGSFARFLEAMSFFSCISAEHLGRLKGVSGKPEDSGWVCRSA